MNPFRKIILWVLPSLFRLSLVALAVAASTTVVFGTSEKIKSTLKQSGIYSSFVDGVIKENIKNNDVPFQNPEIQQVIKSSFPLTFAESSTNQTIDAFYNWLSGKTSQPEFKIELATQKQQIADALGNFIEQRLVSLPVCTTAQLRDLRGQIIDPFSVTCRPANLLPTLEKQRFINEVTNNKEFLGDTTLTIDDLATKQGSQQFAEQYNYLPPVYQWLNRLPLFLGVVSIIMAMGIIFLSIERRKGVRQVAISLLTTGLFLSLATLLGWYLFNQVTGPSGNLSQLSSSELQASLLSIFSRLFEDLNRVLLTYAGIYAVIGLALLLYWQISTPPKPQLENESSSMDLDSRLPTRSSASTL